MGKTPEVQTLEGNTKVAKLSLATTEIYKDKNGQNHSETEWHNVVLWRNLAELAEKYLQKGSKVYIEGKLKTRSYYLPDGSKRYVIEIIADHLIMLNKRPESYGE